MKFKIEVNSKTYLVHHVDSPRSVPFELSPQDTVGVLLGYLGIKEGTTAMVIVDEPEAYEWEWRRDGTRDGLVCTSNGFFYAHRDIRSTQEDYDRTESGLKTSGLWRPGDRIRPRPKKPSFADVIEKAGFEVAQGGQSIALARGHYAFTRDILKAAEIIAQYQKDYPDTWAELVKEWEK